LKSHICLTPAKARVPEPPPYEGVSNSWGTPNCSPNSHRFFTKLTPTFTANCGTIVPKFQIDLGGET
jgi:hypothetical protein